MKNLHKFFTMADLPWVKLVWSKYYRNGKLYNHVVKGSFWWRSLLKLLNIFKGISHIQLGAGDTIIFWSDLWNGRILQQSYPELFSFATNKSITAREVIESGGLESIFQLPLSEEAYEQFCELEVYLQSCQLAAQPNSWTYI
jgi:hypothetical protein